jgi:spermidine synthase
LTWYFFFFFLSGFCSVLYELVWLRLSMAQFGVTTAMVSIVLSVFMAGLGVGSWASGRWIERNRIDPKKIERKETARAENGRSIPALRVYALIELLIGVGGIVVPFELNWGHRILEHSGMSSSAGFYWLAGLWVTLALLPWGALMGATVPMGMEAIRQTLPDESQHSFSYLYLSNVTGAIVGTLVPLLLIELLGFHGTLKVGSVLNVLIALSALALSRKASQLPQNPPTRSATNEPTIESAHAGGGRILALLFLSGLSCMAMEVVWVRSYTPYYGTVVYAFATILSVYLLGTVIGAAIYRRLSSRFTIESPVVWSVLAACALLPLIAASPAIELNRGLRLVGGIMPFTGLLGFITPMLVDRFSAGNPSKAGTAYAINVAGCILGPLLAGFGLLPFLSEKHALVLLALPWLIIGIAPLRPGAHLKVALKAAVCVSLVISAVLIAVGKGYEEGYDPRVVLRDSTATVLATGEGMDKELLVNGYGMTELSWITKVMAHLPLSFLDRPPQNALVICFGMGTTFRSMRSWGIPVTVVELVPSVPRLFGYYHSDAEEVMKSPLSHVVIDDGRRFLERTDQQFDVITIDPPPPLKAAASSLLYSEEFYHVARRRLRPGGILQQWVPTTVQYDAVDVVAITRSLRDSFPYVRAFTNGFGVHYLCSDRAIPIPTIEELLQRMPEKAVSDLVEWDISPGEAPRNAARDMLDGLLRGQVSTEQLIAASPRTPAITDDRPINEYYMVRRWMGHEHTEAASLNATDEAATYVKAEMRRQHIPGLSLLVVKDGTIVCAEGFGLSNVELQSPVKPETVFQSGSVGKQFTATAVMMLVEEGKVGLDDPLAKYFTDAPSSWKDVTVRELLSHTAGFGDYPKNFDFRKDWTEDAELKLVESIPLAYPPGTKWEYSNLGYVTLGILIHQVSGQFYGDFLQEKIFHPLGMDSTRIINEADIIPNRAAGYRLVKGELKNQEWVAPAINTTADGSLYFTILDLAKWDAALYTERLLKRADLDLMWTPAKLKNGQANKDGYGFGWFIEQRNGHRCIHHDGSWQGFETAIDRYVDDRLTVVALTNLADSRPGDITRHVAEMYLTGK